ncbi:MAG TPA: hypothetical protein V6D13_05805 [Halomicronema sp.]
MSILSFVMLLAAVGSGCLYLNTSGEIIRIMALTILGNCFVVLLVMAPWPIQLSILLLVLFITRKIVLPQDRQLR